jgi:hypothetical protein
VRVLNHSPKAWLFIYREAYVYTYRLTYTNWITRAMQNKLPLEYGPREAEILRDLTEAQKIPSKNEGFRRGIIALDYLMDVNREVLFEVLGTSLAQAKEAALRDFNSLPEKLEVSKTLASEIVATYAVQKGAQSADSIDIFRADLDNYLVLAKSKNLKGTKKEEISSRLSVLSEMAYQFAKKEEATSIKTTTKNSERRPIYVKKS